MRNIAMRLMYDGTNYHGWQVQKNDVTVAGTLEAVLSKLCGHIVKLTGCGRTDAGVHAKCYCANFRSDTRIPADRLPLAVNSLLPDDISVTHAIDVPQNFNAILSCIQKEYTYIICNSRLRDPFLRNRAYFYPVPLDLEVMQSAARHFVGTHDFAAVRSVGTETKTTVRTVSYCNVETDGNLINMSIAADGFLYNMVRTIMGTLIYCSEGKIDHKDIPSLLKSGDRQLAGPTVPPGGLYLSRLWYDGDVGAMMSL